MDLSLHNTAISRVNGPGLRFVIWTQGCSLHCRDCFNQPTHNPDNGRLISAKKLASQINSAKGIDGVTLTGGEPLDQAIQLFDLVQSVRTELTWILYTGFTIKEILKNPDMVRMIQAVDLTLSGRFQRGHVHPYVGKKIIKKTNRIDVNSIMSKRLVEFSLSGSSCTKTGIISHI